VVDSGVVIYANPAWGRMFGSASPMPNQGRALRDIVAGHVVHGPILDRNVVAGKRVGGANGDAVCAEGFSFSRLDGTEVRLHLSRTDFRVWGRELQVLSVSEAIPQAQDETEQREAQRLESVGRLASGVAHDFNNLLTGIMLYCDLLIADAVKDGRSHRHADEIRKAGEHGARVVEQLLAVARPPAAAPRVALNEVVKDMEELLTRLIGENIVLTISLSRDLGAVGMNPAQVQQILLNLVLNARDAMRDGGRITIATRNCMNYLQDNLEAKRPADQFSRVEVPENQPWVELTVYDTGCGMDNDTLSHAFEPFFTTKKPGRGSGLGLSTACRLAKLEGGTIVAESQPGTGTRVSLLLPGILPDSADAGSAIPAADSGPQKSVQKDLPAQSFRRPDSTSKER